MKATSNKKIQRKGAKTRSRKEKKKVFFYKKITSFTFFATSRLCAFAFKNFFKSDAWNFIGEVILSRL